MASSRRSTARATSSGPTSPGRRPTSTSSQTTSTSSRSRPATVVIALGSNLGNREYHLRRAVHELARAVRIVRVSSIHETEPVGAPPGSPPFLNMVVTGYTSLAPEALLGAMLAVEQEIGRVRRGIRNEPRVIDLDLILHGGTRMRTPTLTLPHPRAHERDFVLLPLAEVYTSGLRS